VEVVGNYTISLVYGLHYCRTAEYIIRHIPGTEMQVLL